MSQSNLPAIRRAIAELLAGQPRFKSVSPYPTDQVGALPHIQLGFIRAELDQQWDSTTHMHRIPLTIFISMKGRLPDQLEAVEDMIPVLLAQVGADALAELPYVSRCVVAEYNEGVFKHGNVEYVGLGAVLEVKERTVPED